MQIKNILPALMLGALMGMSTIPAAAGVVYQATDLGVAGTTTGSQRWEYSYQVDGFANSTGFTLIYSPSSYANVRITNFLPSPWFQLPPFSDGLDDLLISTNFGTDASVIDFQVEFDWLGSDPPGSQPYETFDEFTFPTGNFRTVSSSASVPEPASLVLVMAGLMIMGWRNLKLRAPSIPPLS